ncbi:Glucosylglycerol-phosphate phosphatase [Acaryochloris thomasi RCC1774]|uniref:Glucosylglycerol-phosphate phosphatase n=1 Tax=Acaryochloris thomasi RCC1774 TaxID=1764569 RepID=A0A2W1K2M5_9CYAN|nr:glucosylglycerol 3-phosphatase [Acaryochloris thomasi]PZD74571.1 Glucosylglycerol-phosphate phosphatase [Acaryochloris thomasi RCC1774]
MPDTPLHDQSLSLDHQTFAALLATTENLLIIQDLDGVCMGLVKDPLTRVITSDYVRATNAFDQHFYVLTNGEHIGQRGVNHIVEKAFKDSSVPNYLPGLAAGGIQWQDREGAVSHPGVSEAELAFLQAVPDRIARQLHDFFQQYPEILESRILEECIAASVLDNKASPTANLNTFYAHLQDAPEVYVALQKNIKALIDRLLAEAQEKDLGDSFFVHYAPNLGQDSQGQELIWFAGPEGSGTTDFQFMVQGAIKEAGVLALLNRYIFNRTGTYPLGEGFNARQAPSDRNALLDLVKTNFDPDQMPTIIGVGDTVNSQVVEESGQIVVRRGGSDRNFLTLIQDIGGQFNTGNLTVYIDSSAGEVKNRKPLKLEGGTVIEGPCDPQDTEDPLQLNMAFPDGHLQYCKIFQQAAAARAAKTSA